MEAEVISWDNPIEATLVEEPRPRRKRRACGRAQARRTPVVGRRKRSATSTLELVTKTNGIVKFEGLLMTMVCSIKRLHDAVPGFCFATQSVNVCQLLRHYWHRQRVRQPRERLKSQSRTVLADELR